MSLMIADQEYRAVGTSVLKGDIVWDTAWRVGGALTEADAVALAAYRNAHPGGGGEVNKETVETWFIGTAEEREEKELRDILNDYAATLEELVDKLEDENARLRTRMQNQRRELRRLNTSIIDKRYKLAMRDLDYTRLKEALAPLGITVIEEN